jgi:rod shape-determining protein MreD
MSTVRDTTHVYPPRAFALSATAIPIAVLVQTSVLPAVGLSSAIPLTFAVVCLLAITLGPRTGALAGFATGLLLDLSGVGVLGVGALIGTVLGVVGARIRVDRWIWSGVGQMWACTAAAAGGYALIDALLVGTGARWSATVWWIGAGALACCLVLLPARNWITRVVR